MTAMIAVRHLTKRFGHLLAVDDISLDVARGEVLGFLGPNGSGKSTTMKMVTGFLTPTAGTAEVCGIDVRRDPIAAQRHFGYLPEGAPAYGDMTPASYLSFIADVRRLSGVSRRQAIDRVIAATHLDRVLQQPIDTLSKGYKRRVGVAQALIHDPDVLILDEPTDGLDPNQKHEVRSLIGEMAGSKAIIISTHILEEVDAVCSRAVIIAEGRIVADGTPDSLERRSPMHNAVRLVVPARSAEAARAGLVGLAGVLRVDVGAGVGDHAELCAFAAPDTEIIAAVAQLARDNGWNVHELRVERGRLDDVFRDITTGRAGAPRGNAHA